MSGLKHAFVSTVADAGNPGGVVDSNDWNAAHIIEGGWNAAVLTSTSLDMDCDNGTKFAWDRTMTTNETLNVPTNLPDGVTINLYVIPGSFTLTWGSGYVFPDASAPVTTTDTLYSITRRSTSYLVHTGGSAFG